MLRRNMMAAAAATPLRAATSARPRALPITPLMRCRRYAPLMAAMAAMLFISIFFEVTLIERLPPPPLSYATQLFAAAERCGRRYALFTHYADSHYAWAVCDY